MWSQCCRVLGDTRTLEIYVRATNAGNFAINIPAFRSYVDTMYRDINKIEDDCGIDANKIKWANAGISDKLEKMGSIKDSEQFEKEKEYIIMTNYDKVSTLNRIDLRFGKMKAMVDKCDLSKMAEDVLIIVDSARALKENALVSPTEYLKIIDRVRENIEIANRNCVCKIR